MSIKLQMHIELQRVLNQVVWQELQDANGCTTQETISLRAAEKVLKLLRIDFTTIQNLTHCVRIHRHWSLYIRDLWNNKLKKMNNNNISADDNNAFERFMAKDYHKPADLYRFATVLMKRTKGHNKSCPYIFAMDGFLGLDVKKYVKNLQYPPVKTTNVNSSSSNGNNNDVDTSSINDECFNPQEIHVNAVRSLYSRFHNVTVESVHRAVMKVICPQEKDEENKKMELEEEENEEEEENKLPHYYRQLIGDHILEIRQWLQTILRQQKQQEQQMKKRLRIRVSKKNKLKDEDEDDEEEEENDDDDDDDEENDDEST